ncbi:dephospho-CoA kinase [Bacteroidota bacterium]
MPNETNKSIVCAITGGIGAGKSTVAELVKEMGYVVISSDDNAKNIMASNQEIKSKLINEFGEKVYNENGEINKEYLSNIVFGPSEKHQTALLKLNSIVHPFVIEFMIKEVSKYEEKGEPFIFVESALTYEAGLEDGFDYVIVVDTLEDIVIDRVKQRSGLSAEDIMLRINQQIPSEKKKHQADFVIENNGSPEELKKSVNIIIKIITQQSN